MINLLGAERQGRELNKFASSCEIIVHDTLGEYDYPASPGVYEDPNQLTYDYPSVNAWCETEGGDKVDGSFLDDKYTDLKPDRDSKDVNSYEPLRPENNENNESVDQGYIHFIN